MSLRNKIITGAVTLVLGSSTLMAFLGKWEGEGQNIVYADKLARGLPTVCKGITRCVPCQSIVEKGIQR